MTTASALTVARLIHNARLLSETLQHLQVPAKDILSLTIDPDLDITVDTARGSLAPLPGQSRALVTVDLNVADTNPEYQRTIRTPDDYGHLKVPLLAHEPGEVHLSVREYSELIDHLNQFKRSNNNRVKLLGGVLLLAPSTLAAQAAPALNVPDAALFALVVFLGLNIALHLSLPVIMRQLPHWLSGRLTGSGLIQTRWRCPETWPQGNALNALLDNFEASAQRAFEHTAAHP